MSNISVLSKDSDFNGKLKENGDVRIEGKFEGTVVAKEKITIVKTGEVKADITAKHVEIGGRLVGNISASNSVKLNSGCKLIGDISVLAGNICIEEGSYFDGTCHMENNKK